MIISRILSALLALFIRVLHATLRVRHVNVENVERLHAQKQPHIISFWHAHLLLMLFARNRRPVVVISSRSRDGEYAAGVFRYYKIDVVRGSSSRGGSSALRELIRAARRGSTIVFTPDGPRGPARVAKDGVVFAAKATGIPIVPLAFAAKKKSCSARGTAWSSRGRSPVRSTCTGHRSRSRATAIPRSGAFVSSRR